MDSGQVDLKVSLTALTTLIGECLLSGSISSTALDSALREVVCGFSSLQGLEIDPLKHLHNCSTSDGADGVSVPPARVPASPRQAPFGLYVARLMLALGCCRREQGASGQFTSVQWSSSELSTLIDEHIPVLGLRGVFDISVTDGDRTAHSTKNNLTLLNFVVCYMWRCMPLSDNSVALSTSSFAEMMEVLRDYGLKEDSMKETSPPPPSLQNEVQSQALASFSANSASIVPNPKADVFELKTGQGSSTDFINALSNPVLEGANFSLPAKLLAHLGGPSSASESVFLAARTRKATGNAASDPSLGRAGIAARVNARPAVSGFQRLATQVDVPRPSAQSVPPYLQSRRITTNIAPSSLPAQQALQPLMRSSAEAAACHVSNEAVPMPPQPCAPHQHGKRQRSASCAIDSLLQTPQRPQRALGDDEADCPSTPPSASCAFMLSTPICRVNTATPAAGDKCQLVIPETPSPTRQPFLPHGGLRASHTPRRVSHGGLEFDADFLNTHGASDRYDDHFGYACDLPATPTPKEKRSSAVPPSPYQ